MTFTPFISKLIGGLRRHPKRIVFPEGSDPRILQAARQLAREKVAVPILLGDRSVVKSAARDLDIKLEGIRIVDPKRTEHFEELFEHFLKKKRFSRFSKEQMRNFLLEKSYFGAMLLDTGSADAIVSGATMSASSALVPLFRTIALQEKIETASSMMILEAEENPAVGIEGVLFLADCGVLPRPTYRELSDIALSTARFVYHVTNETPRVAFVSYTSHGVTKDRVVQKIQRAFNLTQERLEGLDFSVEIDGELQVDAALDAFSAEQKGLRGSVAGRANVLIFPDLHAGNIASKMAQIIANIRAYGQIITGLEKPAAEISRGASAHDIFGTAVIVGAQAIERKLLYTQERILDAAVC